MYKKIVALLCVAICMIPIGVKAADELYVGGDSIGIEVRYDGVMITGTYAIQVDGQLYDPKDHGILDGDIIVAVNEVSVTTMEELYQQIASYQEAVNHIPITIKRGEEMIPLSMVSVYSPTDQTFQSGLYVKDKITGVGTLTFYNPANASFGALGHEIMDTDTKKIADVDHGTIYPADVTSISPAQDHVAGEKHATINYEQVLGAVKKNTNIGIYGTYDEFGHEALKLPWAKQSEVHTGEAQIYTVLEGSTIQTYTINITKLHKQATKDIKGIEFTVNDPTLISQTNGIIQGMSGSPIVQDGKLIGAITHVITSDPMNGYGVYIEWMLEEANTIE